MINSKTKPKQCFLSEKNSKLTNSGLTLLELSGQVKKCFVPSQLLERI